MKSYQALLRKQVNKWGKAEIYLCRKHPEYRPYSSIAGANAPRELKHVLRDMLVLRIGYSVSPESVSEDALINHDMKDLISKMSKSADIKGIIKAYDTMISLKRQMGFNLNKTITWNYAASILRGVMSAG